MHGAEIERSVIGIRSRIGAGAQIRNSLLLGADYYETLDEMRRDRGAWRAARRHRPEIGDRERDHRQERARRAAASASSTRRESNKPTATATSSARES